MVLLPSHGHLEMWKGILLTEEGQAEGVALDDGRSLQRGHATPLPKLSQQDEWVRRSGEHLAAGSHAKTWGANRIEGSVGKGLPWKGRAAAAGVDGGA